MRSGYRIASASALFCAWRCLRPVPADAADSAPTDLRGDRGWFADNGQRATAYRVLGFGPQDGASLASVRGIAPAWLRSAGAHRLGFGPQRYTGPWLVQAPGVLMVGPPTTDNGQRAKDKGRRTPYQSRFFASFASTASRPYQAKGYDDGFRIICVYLCVTAVSREFLDAANGGARRKSRAIGEFGGKRIVVKVFAACRGFVLHARQRVFAVESPPSQPVKAGHLANLANSSSSSEALQLAVASFCRRHEFPRISCVKAGRFESA